MKRPTPAAVLDTVLWLIPWLLVWWGLWAPYLTAFLLGSLLVINYGLYRIWRELRDRP